MSDQRTTGYTVRFAAILCLVCSMLLTAAYSGLKPYQLENMEVDRQKNILKAAGIIDYDASITNIEIKALYTRFIHPVYLDPEGKMLDEPDDNGLTLYLYQEDGAIEQYIVPIESKGLWGKIFAYMAIGTDGKTIKGFTVYSHSETPGLGGEIEKKWFAKNFIGKKIVDQENHFVSVAISKGSAEGMAGDRQSNVVDGISGATLTGRYLSQGIKQNLERYEPVSIRFRQSGTIGIQSKENKQ